MGHRGDPFGDTTAARPRATRTVFGDGALCPWQVRTAGRRRVLWARRAACTAPLHWPTPRRAAPVPPLSSAMTAISDDCTVTSIIGYENQHDMLAARCAVIEVVELSATPLAA